MKMYSSLPEGTSIKTLNQIKSLFNKYELKYSFKRENIENALNVKRTRALDLIRLLLKSNLIVKIGENDYIFKL